jgi:hypothetical protein
MIRKMGRFVNNRPIASAGLAATADKCPISGKPADSTITSKDKDGKTVAFCCEKCKAKFDAKK